jgi:mycothiol synthase
MTRGAAFRGLDDLRRMRELVIAARASGAPGCWNLGDLIWRYLLVSISSHPSEDIRLWEDEDGRLLGFAWIDAYNQSFDWQIAPEVRWRGIEDELLEWIEARHWAMQPAEAGAKFQPLVVASMADDEPRLAFLRRNGFVPEGTEYIHLERSLDDLSDAPALPPGYEVRALAGVGEAEACARCHRQAFNSKRLNQASYLRLMGLPSYDRELDLVAVAPDGGTIASFALVWVDETNRVGEFEPVGTAPDFRRLGLSRAVLIEGLRRMKEAGAETANVATWSAAEAATRLYQSVGFEIVNHEADYVRPEAEPGE